MGIYEQLMKTGYYLGSSLEIFTPYELENIRNYIKKDIDYNFQNKTKNDWKYFLCCEWPDKDSSKNKTLNFHEIPNKIKQIKEESAIITQSWYFKQYLDLSNKPIESHILVDKINSYMSKIYKINNLSGYPSVTYYDKNDFIEPHMDGKSANRVCGMLIYLNSPDEYKKEYGGRLFLQPADKMKEPVRWDLDYLSVQVDPVSPNMVLLDFTKHNILHAVEKCYQNFYRTTLLTFFNLQNSSGI